MALDRVELHPAWSWDCPLCGRENFVRSISTPIRDLDPEEAKEGLVAMGVIEEWQPIEAAGEGCLQLTPDRVTCAHCNLTFDSRFDPPEE